MMVVRVLQSLLVAAIGLFATLVAVDNVIDYKTNFAFVQHVLSMDTTFPDNGLMWRAITDGTVHHIAYWIIIVCEGLTGLLCLAGALVMLCSLRLTFENFQARKALAFAGLGLGFLLWFVGFMVVGAEWFKMWQSETWNAQQSAFRFIASIGFVLIFLTYER